MPESLVELNDLEALLKVPENSLLDDPYTELIIRSANAKVRSVAHQPGWVGSEPLEDQTVAPERAQIIALWLAKQAWEDQGNLQRRTAGPISETFFEGGIRGLALSEADSDYLTELSPGGNTNGLWIMKHQGTGVGGRRRVETPDGYSFSDGDLNFAHGMDMRGPADADSW